ncbi:MAG: DVU0259 family response regulator domain-containing protein [Desulfobacterales bacterium]
MGKKILIVEDDPAVVNFLSLLFRDNGYDVCSATDGFYALEVMRDERPDMVTLDLEMPKEWGTRFFRKFKKDDILKDTPVLIISAMPSKHLSIRGAVGYLHKPFKPEEVIRIVRETIGEA